MNRQCPETGRQQTYYPIIVISDLHLIKSISQAGLLLEFLSNVACDKLILNGDIIDGWKLQSKKHRKIDEMHARVIDAILAKAAHGTDVTWLAGNHDERLRQTWSNESTKARPAHPLLNRNHIFTNRDRSIAAPVHVADILKFTDPDGQRIVFLHGDQYDPRALKTKNGRALSRLGDKGYDGLIRINAYAIKVGHRYLKKHFSLAAYVKKHAKKAIGVIEKFEQAVVESGKTGEIDVIATGHIHHAEIRRIGNITYMNSGDWVESATALVYEKGKGWDILHWAEKRHEFGLTKIPDGDDVNPFAAYRGVTARVLRGIQYLWPAKNRHDLVKILGRLEKLVDRREIGLHTATDHFAADTAMAKLQAARGQRDLIKRWVQPL